MSTHERTDGQPKYSAPAAACAGEVLLALARAEGTTSLAELARAVCRSKSIVFRSARELETLGLITRTSDGRYTLGTGAMEVAGGYMRQTSLDLVARRALQSLSRGTQETANLAVLDGADILYILKEHSERPIVTISHVGGRLPSNCTALGKCLLAELPEEELHKVLTEPLPALTPRSITTLKELRGELDRVRRLGYAIDDQEGVVGRSCVGVALRVGAEGLDRAAISVSVKADELKSRLGSLLEALATARATIESESKWRSRLEGPAASSLISATGL